MEGMRVSTRVPRHSWVDKKTIPKNRIALAP
jgi:hypothetical protein